jgi:DNA polymerase-1
MNTTSETWNRDIADMIDEAGDNVSLLKTAAQLWGMRHYQDALKYAIPRFRSRLASFGGTKQPVVAVDFNNMAHANWYTGNPLRDSMAAIYRDTSPGTFIVTSDSFRKPSSKAPPTEEFYVQNEKFKQAMVAKGVQWEEVEGREADDILASIAFTCQIAGLDCVLVTTDEDLFQVLGPKTCIYDRKHKAYRNADWLMAYCGVTPKQWPDVMTLAEECEGIGEKGAKDLIKAYGDVDGIHKNAHLLKPKQRTSILNFWPHYYEARKKHFIERDIPVGWK